MTEPTPINTVEDFKIDEGPSPDQPDQKHMHSLAALRVSAAAAAAAPPQKCARPAASLCVHFKR